MINGGGVQFKINGESLEKWETCKKRSIDLSPTLWHCKRISKDKVEVFEDFSYPLQGE